MGYRHDPALRYKKSAAHYHARFHRAMAKFWSQSGLKDAQRLVNVHTGKAAKYEARQREYEEQER
jgi:hypothetical protein